MVQSNAWCHSNWSLQLSCGWEAYNSPIMSVVHELLYLPLSPIVWKLFLHPPPPPLPSWYYVFKLSDQTQSLVKTRIVLLISQIAERHAWGEDFPCYSSSSLLFAGRHYLMASNQPLRSSASVSHWCKRMSLFLFYWGKNGQFINFPLYGMVRFCVVLYFQSVG